MPKDGTSHKIFAMKYHENMEDYLRWRGDLTFSENGLNVIDSMIFAQLTYVDFSNVLSKNMDDISLAECVSLIDAMDEEDREEAYNGNEALIRLAADSARFGDVHLANYQDITDEEPKFEFTAVEFRMDEDESFIAFRGNMLSIESLKEDFLFALRKSKAHEYAEQYIWSVMEQGRIYYVGGHGRGGSLAVYAAASLDHERQDQLIRIFDLDCPGFAKENFNLDALLPIREKIISVIPDYCVIGHFFPLDLHDIHIVKTTKNDLSSHELVNWLVEGNHLIEAEEEKKESQWIAKTIDEWTDSSSYDARKRFADELFDRVFEIGDDQENAILTVLYQMNAESSNKDRIKLNDEIH